MKYQPPAQNHSTIATLLHPDSFLDATAAVEAMIKKYSCGVGEANAGSTSENNWPWTDTTSHVVLLTGSTGALGSYLLASLLENHCVAVVYALNRSSEQSSVQQRQRAGFEDRGLDITLLESKKLIYLEVDASQTGLGLGDKLYEEVFCFL